MKIVCAHGIKLLVTVIYLVYFVLSYHAVHLSNSIFRIWIVYYCCYVYMFVHSHTHTHTAFFSPSTLNEIFIFITHFYQLCCTNDAIYGECVYFVYIILLYILFPAAIHFLTRSYSTKYNHTHAHTSISDVIVYFSVFVLVCTL